MPAYKFTGLPASTSVTVYLQGTTTVVTSGTTDSNGTLLATLAAGDYTARAVDSRGRSVKTHEELVTPFDPDTGTTGGSATSDASALTTGTLDPARLADGSVPEAKLTTGVQAKLNSTSGALVGDVTPEQYGAVGDARAASVSTTSGSPTVTTAVDVFTNADVGAKIMVSLSASTGAFLYGTITAVAGPRSATVSANASATASSRDAFLGHDDTAAITAAMDAVAPLGGTVRFTAPGYLVDGAVRTDREGRAVLPLLRRSVAAGNSTTTTHLLAPSPRGSTIYATAAGNLYTTWDATNGVPSVIGGPTQERVLPSQLNATDLVVEGLRIVVPPNPTVTAIDARRVARFKHRRGVVYGLGARTIGGGLMWQPTYTWAAGTLYPGESNYEQHEAKNVIIYGFYLGSSALAEHAYVDCLTVVSCIICVAPQLANHLAFGHHLSLATSPYMVGTWNPATGLAAPPADGTTATRAVVSATLDIEEAPATGGDAWKRTVAHIADPAGVLRGRFRFLRIVGGSGAQAGLTTSGPANYLIDDLTLTTGFAAPGAAMTAPGQVAGLTGTPQSGQVALAWTAPANGGSPITDYEVYFRTSGGTYTQFADGTSTTTAATVTGLTNGTAYDFYVRAVNAIGAGLNSDPITVTPSSSATAPGQVQSLSASPGNGQALLSWSAPGSNGGSAITDYIVEFRTGANAFAVFADGTSTSTTATVTGLTNGTAYDFRVSAVNAVGTGTPSSVASTTPVNALVADSFNRTDTADGIGNTEVPGTAWTSTNFRILGNLAKSTTGVPNPKFGISAGTSEARTTVRFVWRGEAFRVYQNASAATLTGIEAFYFQVSSATAGTLHRVTSTGTDTAITATVTLATMTVGQTYERTVNETAGAITILQDGVTKHTVSSTQVSAMTGQFVGIVMVPATNNGLGEFDSFTVTPAQ